MASKESHDPGWNDPPIFTYDKATAIQAAAATKKGTLLNKRVAFPISGSTHSNTQPNSMTDLTKPLSLPSSLPPPPSSVAPVSKVELKSPPESSIQVKDKLADVLKNFQIDEDCDFEIVKRIKVMEKMWEENKLDDCVRLKIFELSEALAKNDTETADHIQKGLMVDYVSQCSSWMSGIRHLINKKK